jgi:hypothetical protein
MFGRGSLYLDGLSSLSVPANASFAPGTGEFDLIFALFPTAFLAGNNQGISDRRTAVTATPDVVAIENTVGSGKPKYCNGNQNYSLVALKLNQWQVYRVSRYQGVLTFYLDDIPVYSIADNSNLTNQGNWILFDILDTVAPNSGMYQGYCQYIRDIRASLHQGYGSNSQAFLKPPLTDRDPLETFKVLDINCDGGAIVDRKGHAITINGAAAVSSAQKRAGSNSIALTGGSLDVAGGADFNFGSTPYSIHASVRFTVLGTANSTSSPNNQYVWDFEGGDTSALFFTSRTAYPGFNISNANAIAVAYPPIPVINNWYDMELAKIDDKYLLIQNNQVVAGAATAPPSANLPTMRVGGYRLNQDANTQGFVDSISVYRGIANGANLTHSYPLRFLARFSGGSPDDELGAVGTIVGTPHTYDSTNKRSLDASALFPGTGYITYPSISAYDLGALGFEIAGWINVSSSPQNAVAGVMSIGSATNTFDSQVVAVFSNAASFTSVTGRSTTNKLSLWAFAVAEGNAVLCSTTTINDGQPHYWRIIKYVIGASAVTVLVIDGKIEDVYIGAYTIAATTRGITVGFDRYDSSRYFKGNLDDLAIYRA